MLADWARFAGFFAFALFALVGSLLWALNYPPQDAEWTCKTETESHQPNHNRVRILSCRKSHPPKLQNEAANAEGKSDSNAGEDIKVTDKLLVVFTAFLVIVGGVQAFYLWSTVRATAVAANAADLSARAAINVELPILAAEASDFHFATVEEQNSNGILEKFDCCFAHYLNVVNGGRTKARLIQVDGGWHFGNELPAAPNYTFTKHLSLTAILDPEAEEPMRIGISDYHLRTEPDTYDAIRYARSSLWFFCRIVYLDFMRERHEAGFCWRRYEGVGGGFFVEERAAAYNRQT